MASLTTRRRPRRVRARTRGRRARTAAARRARSAVQPALEVSAPVVVGGAHRRGLPAVLGRAGAQARPGDRPVPRPRRRRRDRGAAGPLHRRPDVHHPAGPFGAPRAVLPRARAVAVPGPPRRRPPPTTPPAPRARGRAHRGHRRLARCRAALAHLERAGRSAAGTRPRRGCATTPPPRSTPCGAANACDALRRGRRTGRRHAPTARAAGTSRSSGTASWPRRAMPAAACRRCPSSTRFALPHSRFCRARRRWAARSSRRRR